MQQEKTKTEMIDIKITDAMGNGIAGNGISGNGIEGNGMRFEYADVLEDFQHLINET